ncbi:MULTISPECIES: hypothetical protein [Streptomyces]|uniref:Uncharacterized protein n=2 Tax=Streptomyces TaxID=1883 RepID=A0ABU4K3J9_9ACTN|nr:hypothetical protein [Streptomyces roseolus]MDX2292327.1 hypothetical protein [Streptomyces roseolus]
MRHEIRVGETVPLGGRVLGDEKRSRILFATTHGRCLAERHTWNKRVRSTIASVPFVHSLGGHELDGDPLGDSHVRYGGSGSFLVDHQGIDAFLFARSKYFDDMTARQVAIAADLVADGRSYLRVGAAGAPPTGDHPGGEVLEHSVLDAPSLTGVSYSASGYLPPGSEFSKAVPLSLPTSSDLLERRSVYSHTAFLARTDRLPEGSHLLRLEGRPDGLNALDAIKDFVSANRIDAYAIRMFIRAADAAAPPRIVGRVLRRIPHRRLRTVQEATDIASEQEFRLESGQELHCYGTYWPRRSIDWEALRGGKPYEPRGHIHMEVRGGPVGSRQHAISHLRELFVTPGTECFVLINPINDVIRIEPVVKRGDALLSKCSGRPFVEEFSSIPWSNIL